MIESSWHALRAHIEYLLGELKKRRFFVRVATGEPIGQSAMEWAELEEACYRANLALAAMPLPAPDVAFWDACRGNCSSLGC